MSKNNRDIPTDEPQGIQDGGNKNGKKDKAPKSWLREVLEYVKLIGIVVVIMLLLQNFVIINAQIPSESMEKTIMVGDRIFGYRLAYKTHDPQRYDVVIFRYPDDEKEYFIKRVIGLPGESVDIIDGKVYINGSQQALDDSFCPEMPTGIGDGHFEVPADSYFMLGDNRNVSKDSRFWNNPYVNKNKILGEAIFRYWPFNKMGTIH